MRRLAAQYPHRNVAAADAIRMQIARACIFYIFYAIMKICVIIETQRLHAVLKGVRGELFEF